VGLVGQVHVPVDTEIHKYVILEPNKPVTSNIAQTVEIIIVVVRPLRKRNLRPKMIGVVLRLILGSEYLCENVLRVLNGTDKLP